MSDSPETLRLFVALELPAGVRAALPVVGPPWRALSPEALHVTLAFLGWRPVGDVAVVGAAVRGALMPVEPVRLIGMELLPPGAPRVMAVRLDDPSGRLVALQRAVSDALVAAGVYVAEQRAWLPHITIGRTKERVGRGAPVPEVSRVEFQPESVALMRSQLRPGGAQYEGLARFALPVA